MRALTIRQPWADAIVSGDKRVENRRWGNTSVIGERIAIHAGKVVDEYWQSNPTVVSYYRPARWSELEAWVRTAEAHSRLGAVIGVATVTDVHRANQWISNGPFVRRTPKRCGCGSRWAERSLPEDELLRHWVLEDVVMLDRPVEARGTHRLWRLPADVEERVLAQVAEAPECDPGCGKGEHTQTCQWRAWSDAR